MISIPLDRKGYFHFTHACWDRIRDFAKRGGEIRIRTLYARIQIDYYQFLEDELGADKSLIKAIDSSPFLIFESWVDGMIMDVACYDPVTSVLINHRSRPGMEDKCSTYALIYEVINFATYNLNKEKLGISRFTFEPNISMSFSA